VVRLYQEGLQWRHAGRDHQRPWEDVREVYRKEVHVLQNNAKPSDWNRRSQLRLVFTDGEQSRFNHMLSDYNPLAEYVQRATSAILYPSARAAMLGTGADFGVFRLSREGLTIGSETVPWATLSKVWAGNGYLGWNDTRGYQRSFPLQEIPNYLVVLRLIEEMTQMAGTS
jgi:hypothetical protein